MCAEPGAVFTASDDYWPACEHYKEAKPQIGKVTGQMEGFLKPLDSFRLSIWDRVGRMCWEEAEVAPFRVKDRERRTVMRRTISPSRRALWGFVYVAAGGDCPQRHSSLLSVEINPQCFSSDLFYCGNKRR